MASVAATGTSLSLGRRLALLSWPLVVLLCIIAAVGVAMLYSAGGGSWEPWAVRQVTRFGVALAVMLAVALVDLRFWLRYAYAIYFASVVLLVAVEVAGATGMGAQRWIDLGVVRLQPSELMKIALILGLARYFHGLSMEDIGRPVRLVVPLLMILAPAFLVLRQPDLGTAGDAGGRRGGDILRRRGEAVEIRAGGAARLRRPAGGLEHSAPPTSNSAS